MNSRTLPAVRLAIAAALTALSLDTAAAGVNRSGSVAKFDGVDGIAYSCTTSQTFTNMPDMTRTFSLPAGGTASVVVMFNAALNLSSSAFDTGFVRLTIDNQVVGPGDQVPVIGAETGSPESEEDGHGFTWQTKPLAAGSHTARISWRTDGGSSLCVDARSMIILHK